MDWKSILRSTYLVGLLTVGLMSAPTDPALAAWYQVENEDGVILFQPPHMGDWSKDLYIERDSAFDSRSEWLCWGKVRNRSADACVNYQTTINNKGFAGAFGYPSDIYKFFRVFDGLNPNSTGDAELVQHELGEISYSRFRIEIYSGTLKNCAAFNVDLQSRKKMLIGWYCAGQGQDLNGDLIVRMLSTIGLKGKYEPPEEDYSNTMHTQVPGAPQQTGATDQVVCVRAMTYPGQGPAAWGKDAYAEPWIEEAKKRGFTLVDCVTKSGLEF